MSSRREQEKRGSKGGPRRKERTRGRSHGGTPRRRERALQTERAKKVPKNKVRGKLRKNETENTTQHGVVRGDGGERERQRMAKVQKERSNLRDRRTRNRVLMTTTPDSADRPLRLVIHPGGRSSAAGKLTSHCRREAEGVGGSLEIRKAVR